MNRCDASRFDDVTGRPPRYRGPMTYTFWHDGLLIGQADLRESADHPRHFAGIFYPTAYGLEVYSRVAGLFSAAHSLKARIEPTESLSDHFAKPESSLDSTPEGQRVMGISQRLTRIEVRDPGGQRAPIRSLVFSEVDELYRILRAAGSPEADHLANLPPDAPKYVVNITLGDEIDRAMQDLLHSGRPRPWNVTN